MGKIVKSMSTSSERKGQDRRHDRRHQEMVILHYSSCILKNEHGCHGSNLISAHLRWSYNPKFFQCIKFHCNNGSWVYKIWKADTAIQLQVLFFEQHTSDSYK